MNFFRHHWHWKLLCLVGATMLMLYVRKQEDRVQRTLYLPLVATVPAGQRMVQPPPGSTVRVDLEGPSELVRAISPDDLTLLFDPSAVQPGKRTDVPVVVEIAEKYRSRVMVDWRPSNIPVRIVSDASKPFSVTIQQTDRPEGWEFKEGPTADPVRVLVNGNEEIVSRVDKVIASLKVPEVDRIYEPSIKLEAVDAQGKVLTEQVHIDPPLARITGVQQRVVFQKRIPVQPIFEVPPGMRIQAVEVVPKTVRVVGKQSQVGSVYVAETVPMDLVVGKTVVTQDLGIANGGDGIRFIPDQVRVTVKFQPTAPSPAPAESKTN
jgi:YbbR domain-containing protein